MRRGPGEELKDDADLISKMGRERMALTGYVLPHAVGPATVFLAVAGFVLSVTVAGRLRW